MFKALEKLSDKLLNRFVPTSEAGASCPCGSYPYTGPCYTPWKPCGNGNYYRCYCADSSRIYICGSC